MTAVNSRIATDPTLEDQATAALTMITHRLNTPFRDKAKRLLAVLADLDGLAASGHNENECRLYEVVIAARNDLNFGGKSATCEKIALRMELEADTQEDHTQGTVAIEGETPTTLELHARALEKQAAASRTLAAIRRRRAREIQDTRCQARQRFGL